MNKRAFIDINIALDLLLQREPFYADVEDLFALAHDNKIELFIAAHSFVIIDYVASKAMNFSKRKNLMLNFKKWVTVLPLNDEIISSALLSATDFEDEIQQLIAVRQKVDVLITHDIKGFKNCPISVMSAKQFIKTLTL
ncbi:MAG: PIN domain-containing protein [Parafilimonas sp.]